MCQAEPLAGTGVRLNLAQFSVGQTSKLMFKYKPNLIATELGSDASALTGLFDWIDKDWTRKDRRPRFAALCYEGTTSRQTEDPSVLAYGKYKDIEVLPWTYFSFLATDFGTELRRIIEQQKADYVWLRAAPSQVAPIMKDAVRLGYKDKAKWVAGQLASDPVIVKITGKDVIEGVYLLNTGISMTSDKGWGVDLAKQLFKKYRKRGEFAQLYMAGIHAAMFMQESMKRALEKYGKPEKLNGKRIIDAYYTIKNFDTGGIAPITSINYPNPAMVSKTRITQWQKDGSMSLISDWIDVPWIFGNKDYKTPTK